MRRFIVITLSIFAVICLVAFVPYRINVRYDGTLYEGDVVEEGRVITELKSLAMPYRINLPLRLEGCAVKTDWLYLSADTDIPFVKVRKIEGEYTKDIYEGEMLDLSAFRAKVIFEDGYERDVTVSPDELQINNRTEYPLNTERGMTTVEIVPISVKDIEVTVLHDILEGDRLTKEDISVKKIFEDGRKEDVEFAFDEQEIYEPTVVSVTSCGITKEVTVTPVKVASVTAGKTNHKNGQEPGIEKITFIYENGVSVTVDRSEIHFDERLNQPMVKGANVYHFTYKGRKYELTINASESSIVEDAARHFAEEAEIADYSYVSDTIFVTVTKHNTENTFFFLTHVVIEDPSQLRSGLSYGDYGGARELPTDAAKRLNWIVGTNGSNFNYATGTPEYAGVCIKNRQVMEGKYTDGREICLMSNGVLFSPEGGVDAQKLIASGVTDSWSCGDTLLINDGYAVNVGIQSQQYRYPRTAIGMVQPCEYYLITAGDGNYGGGMSYDEVRDVLMMHGCSFGKCMDGGGSSSLVFRGELLNTPAVNDEERAVVDFLYFVE